MRKKVVEKVELEKVEQTGLGPASVREAAQRPHHRGRHLETTVAQEIWSQDQICLPQSYLNTLHPRGAHRLEIPGDRAG